MQIFSSAYLESSLHAVLVSSPSTRSGMIKIENYFQNHLQVIFWRVLFSSRRSFFDAFYFCFITSTTIGLGDMTPSISGGAESEFSSPNAEWYRIWASFFTSISIMGQMMYASNIFLYIQIYSNIFRQGVLHAHINVLHPGWLSLHIDNNWNNQASLKIMAFLVYIIVYVVYNIYT